MLHIVLTTDPRMVGLCCADTLALTSFPVCSGDSVEGWLDKKCSGYIYHFITATTGDGNDSFDLFFDKFVLC